MSQSVPWKSALILVLILLGRGLGAAQTSTNLLKNPGFENLFQRGGWDYSGYTISQGALSRSREWSHSERYSLKLVPNQTNIDDWRPYEFSLHQTLPANVYRGKPLYFGGWMRADGGATAVLRLLAVRQDGQIIYREVRQENSSPEYWRDILDVPDEPLASLVFTCGVKGTSGAAYFDDVVVSADLAATVTVGQPDPGPPLGAFVTVHADQTVRRIPPALYGMNLEWVFNGHTLWDRYSGRLDDHLLNLSSDLGVTMWRFPGGVFANHYSWQNGVGPQELRPAAPIEPGGALSEHGFGTDEALAFTAATRASDTMITVNCNTGTPEEAAEWVRYVNNGTRRVNYWEIGNELYLRVLSKDGEPVLWTPETYSQTFLEFASAMRAVDPSIKIGADIEFHYPFSGCARMGETGCWTDVVLRDTASQLDFVSVHNGFSPLGLAPLSGGDAGWDVRTVYAGMLGYPVLLKRLMQDLGRKIDSLSGDHAPRIRIAVSEWGPLFDIGPYSRLVDHVKTLGAALYTASTFKVLLEDPRVDVATAFKLLDEVVFGWIGPRQGKFVPKPSYYAFQLYARNLGPILVNTNTVSPTYDTRSVLGVPAIKGVPYLDVVSSTNDERSMLSMVVINKHFDRAIRVSFRVPGFSADGKGTAWTLTGAGLDANTGTDVPFATVAQSSVEPNGRFHLGGPGEVWVTSSNVTVSGSCFQYEFPPHSVTALVLRGGPPSSDAPPPECTDLPPPSQEQPPED